MSTYFANDIALSEPEIYADLRAGLVPILPTYDFEFSHLSGFMEPSFYSEY